MVEQMKMKEAAALVRQLMVVLEKNGYELDWIDGDEGLAQIYVQRVEDRSFGWSARELVYS